MSGSPRGKGTPPSCPRPSKETRLRRTSMTPDRLDSFFQSTLSAPSILGALAAPQRQPSHSSQQKLRKVAADLIVRVSGQPPNPPNPSTTAEPPRANPDQSGQPADYQRSNPCCSKPPPCEPTVIPSDSRSSGGCSNRCPARKVLALAASQQPSNHFPWASLGPGGGLIEDQEDFADFWSPSRVLDQCRAKRKLIFALNEWALTTESPNAQEFVGRLLTAMVDDDADDQ